MLISRITLKDNIETLRLFESYCENEYKVHQHLWNLFSLSKNQPRNFLYRRDDIGRLPRFYTVSQNSPVNHKGLWDITTKPYDPQLKAGQELFFQLRVNPTKRIKGGGERKGKKYSAESRHDIIMREKDHLEKEGRFNDNVTFMPKLIHDVGVSWLKDRAENFVWSKEKQLSNGLGFQVVDEDYRIDGQKSEESLKQRLKLVVEGYRQVKFFRGQEWIRISVLDFSGVLRVTNPTLLKETLFSGIGPAKAFGCGLMLVRRVY